MQKDVHFYLTYALARKVGIDADLAAKLAWADQFTDELVKAEAHGIQTQSAVMGNWADPEIQRCVLVPFHFIPGGQVEYPWAVTANSHRAIRMLNGAITDAFGFGIALHTFQDTFSHQGWTGWNENFNACFQWYYLQSGIPNIGHAEMAAVPDIASAVWTDPRTGKQINNKMRATICAELTCLHLSRFLAASQNRPTFTIENQQRWNLIAIEFKEAFEIEAYDKRKEVMIELSGEQVRYKDIDSKLQPRHKQDFIRAAGRHLALAMDLIKDLPGPE